MEEHVANIQKMCLCIRGYKSFRYECFRVRDLSCYRYYYNNTLSFSGKLKYFPSSSCIFLEHT